MSSLFKNLTSGRLRAGWRIGIFAALFWICSTVVFLLKPLFPDLSRSEFIQQQSLLIVVILAIAATLSVYLCRKFLDKKSFLSLGLQLDRSGLKQLGTGILLSAAMGLTFFGILYFSNVIVIDDIGFAPANKENNLTTTIAGITVTALLVVFFEHILVGYWEELVFRGYLLHNMTEGMGLKLAVVISCLLYGVVHSINPNATLLSSSIIVLFGFLRIYGYLLTGKLWLSMGMHICWNFIQGPVLGFGASGHQYDSVVRHHFTPIKEHITGGAFGPEGSIVIIPVLFLTLIVMYRLYGSQKLSGLVVS